MTNAQKKLRDLRHDAPSSFFMEALGPVIPECTDEVQKLKLRSLFWAFSMTSHFRCDPQRGLETLDDSVFNASLEMLAFYFKQAKDFERAEKISQESLAESEKE